METKSIKKIFLKSFPYLIFGYIGNHLSWSYRVAGGKDISEKIIPFSDNVSKLMPLISFHPIDLLIGVGIAGVMFLVIRNKRKHRKNFKDGTEYGSARWGTSEDVEPYIDDKNFENNAILTSTERLTIGKPKHPKYARNLNVLVEGGSGSGKTRFYVKPNLMQMHSSYVVTDPKGTALIECGKMLERGKPYQTKDGKTQYKPYKITVFNTIDFDKSMHYNPFHYIRETQREQDILKLVEVFIANTTGEQKGGDEFWVKSEKLLYTAYISLILI